jgi:hypothetical protein
MTSGDVTGALGYTPSSGYSLPVATASTLGGVKCGTGISCAGDGTASVSTFYDASGAANAAVNAAVNGLTGYVAAFTGTHVISPIAHYSAAPAAGIFAMSDSGGTLNAFVTTPFLGGSTAATDITSTYAAVVGLTPSVYMSFATAVITATASGTANIITQCRIRIAVDGSYLEHGSAVANTTAGAFWDASVTVPVSLSYGAHYIDVTMDEVARLGGTCTIAAESNPTGSHGNVTVIGR